MADAPSALRREWSTLSRLAGPSILTSVGMMGISVVDTLMVARVGVGALAAGALGSVVWAATVFVSTGLARGIEPFVSQAHGAGDTRALSLLLQRGVVLALLLSGLLVAVLSQTGRLLLLAGQEPALAAAADDYIHVQLIAVPFAMVSNVLACYLQARTLVRPPMWNMLLANVVNAFANWVLIFGHLGFDAMGLHGAGLASSATYIAACLGLIAHIVVAGLHRDAWFGWQRACLSPGGLLSILAVGGPISAHLATEMWAWSGSTLLAGRLGANGLAAHQIVLNMASLTFMVPLGVSVAASTRIGNLIGAGRADGVRDAMRMALFMGIGAMVCSAVGFVLLRDQLGRLYTSDPSVLVVCAGLLPIVAAFQVLDGAQVVATGLLRGMGRTRAPAVVNFTGYWLLALPLGWWLAFDVGLGVRGIWLALAGGLCFAAVLLLTYLAKVPVPDRL